MSPSTVFFVGGDFFLLLRFIVAQAGQEAAPGLPVSLSQLG